MMIKLSRRAVDESDTNSFLYFPQRLIFSSANSRLLNLHSQQQPTDEEEKALSLVLLEQ